MLREIESAVRALSRAQRKAVDMAQDGERMRKLNPKEARLARILLADISNRADALREAVRELAE